MYVGFIIWEPYILASVGQPSLFVFMHVWFLGLRGHSGEIAGKNNVRPLFLLYGFFCLVGILGNGSGVKFFGIFGLGGPGILGHPPCPVTLVLSFLMSVVGSLMAILLLGLGLIFLLLLSID